MCLMVSVSKCNLPHLTNLGHCVRGAPGNTTSSSDTLEWAEFRLPGALLGRRWGCQNETHTAVGLRPVAYKPGAPY